MRSRSQPHNQHPRVRIAEPRHRLPPILPVPVGAPLLPRHLLAISHQPRAAGAGNHFPIQDRKPIHRAITSHPRNANSMSLASRLLNALPSFGRRAKPSNDRSAAAPHILKITGAQERFSDQHSHRRDATPAEQTNPRSSPAAGQRFRVRGVPWQHSSIAVRRHIHAAAFDVRKRTQQPCRYSHPQRRTPPAPAKLAAVNVLPADSAQSVPPKKPRFPIPPRGVPPWRQYHHSSLA